LQKIDDAKELKKLVKFSFSEKTAIVINDIDQATTETANAFLKNLEEPTKNIIYILTTKNLSGVLPTIVSRCEIVRVQGLGIRVQKVKRNYKDALNIKDRDEAIKFIEDLLIIDHQNKVFENMENYLKTIRNLKANGNVTLQLTNFVAKMATRSIINF
jgi:DNA polymerase III delta prime subunit